MENNEEKKVYKDERFEFALYVNEVLICRRTFKMYNFIEESMSTMDFKETVDDIVNMIDNDLKSKSRVYTWYMFNEDDVYDEFKEELLQPWECTFKFVVMDNKVPVIQKIWDGYGYPKSIRTRVDLTNRFVKIYLRDGRVLSFEKEKYFADNDERLTPEMYVLKQMIIDKGDLTTAIIKKICETCSPREDGYNKLTDYSLYDTYQDRNYVRNEDGTLKVTKKGKMATKLNREHNRKYYFTNSMREKKFIAEWGKAVAEKTKEYFKNLN